MSHNLANQHQAVDAAIEKAATAEEYQTPAGARVRRPRLVDLLDAQDRLDAKEQAKKRGGLFERVGFGGPR